jgi:membrane associated rhomboid family serine protease
LSDITKNTRRSFSEKKRVLYSMLIPGFFVFVAFTLKLIETLEGVSFAEFGIKPHSVEGLPGILFSPLIHGDWGHLYANALPMFVLGTALFYFYRDISLKVFVFIYLFTGILLWAGGRTGTWHIGASGLIYGLGSFLFLSGVIRNYIPLTALSLIVVFLYGSLFWGMFPIKWDLPYSWEAHLAGTLTGIILAVVYRKEGPQKPVPFWYYEELEESEEEPFWESSEEGDGGLK